MIGRKRSVILTLFVLSMVILIPGISSAWEEVENVRMEQVGDDVHIYYDLRGDADKYNVTVRGSSDGGRNYRLPMKTVSGDVGNDVLPGSNKKIIWKALKDAEELEGDEFVFEVEAVSGPGKEFVNSIGMKFVYIQPGTFMMGSPSNEPKRESDERQHKVTLTKGFYMGTTEVTQGQWREIMGNNPSRFKGDNLPVEQVSWNDCRALQEFIWKLNQQEGLNQPYVGNRYRLPTEAQWEYACRAGTTTPFYTGNCISTDQANYNGNHPMPSCSKGMYRKKTVEVASFSPNAWGLYDMHGNVWEWCEDRYEKNYPSGHVTDPKCPSSGTARVLRGGSWYDYAGFVRSANRSGNDPGLRYDNYGFRVVRAN